MTELNNYLPEKSDFPDVDYWEVHLEEVKSSSIDLKNGEIEVVTGNTTDFGNVRVLYNGGWGFSSFNRLDDIREHIRRAIEFARSVGGGEADVVKLPAVEDEIFARYDNHPDDVTLDEKLDVVYEYDAKLNDHPRAEKTLVKYGDNVIRRCFLNSDGRLLEREEIYTTGLMSIHGKADGVPERSFRNFRHRAGFEDYLIFGEKIPEILDEFDDILKAENAKGGVYNCILNPMMAGVFAHESFGHTSEADNIYRDPQMAEVMKIGKKLGSENITIVDDGTVYPFSAGYNPYDDEGVMGGRTVLLNDGVLTAHLHSRETARLMGEEVTGNARAINAGFPPIVRMTNTFITGGDASYDELLQELGDGLLVVGSRGGMGGENFTFAAIVGYIVEDGEVTKPVKNFTLTGNLFETLKKIKMCSDEIEIHSTGGGCGKAEQQPLPVGHGGPYVLLENALIGGR